MTRAILAFLRWINRDWRPTDYVEEAREAERLKIQHESDVPVIFYWIEKEK
jgi:hypothetical protein